MTPAGGTHSPAGDSVLLGEDARGFYIRVSGSVRAPDCYPLREDVLERLGAEGSTAGVWADLSACRYMDSTFIGLLVALDTRLKKNGGRRLLFTAISPECLDALSRLGLEKVLLTKTIDAVFPADMRTVLAGKPGADFVLKAHEALMERSEEAKKKFGLLREMLLKKLKKDE